MNLNLGCRIERLEEQHLGDEFDNMSQDELRVFIQNETVRLACISEEVWAQISPGIDRTGSDFFEVQPAAGRGAALKNAELVLRLPDLQAKHSGSANEGRH